MALLAALASAPAVLAEDTYTISMDTTIGTQNYGNYYGWTMTLTERYLDTTLNDQQAELATTSVLLNSVSLQKRTSGDASGNTAYLAIYEYDSDGTVGTFVGVSTNTVTDNTVSQTPAYNTFEFSGVTLDATKQYQYLFVTTNSTDTLSTFTGYQGNATKLGFSITAVGSTLDTGDGIYTTSALNGWQNGNYMPNVSISVTATPEPTTATLSLLALAGLCARRRRK